MVATRQGTGPPTGAANAEIKGHIRSLGSRMNPDGSTRQVTMREGERKTPEMARERIEAKARADRQQAAQPQPEPAPAQPRQETRQPEPEREPSHEPSEQQPASPEPQLVDEQGEASAPESRDEGQISFDRFDHMKRHKQDIEGENSKLKEELAFLKGRLAGNQEEPQTAESPDFDEMTEAQQLDHMVNQRVNEVIGPMLPQLQEAAAHQSLNKELGLQLTPDQSSAINKIWGNGQRDISAAEAAAIADFRDKALFGATGNQDRPSSQTHAERPRGESPKRQPKDEGAEKLAAFQDPNLTGAARTAAGRDLLKHRLIQAFKRKARSAR